MQIPNEEPCNAVAAPVHVGEELVGRAGHGVGLLAAAGVVPDADDAVVHLEHMRAALGWHPVERRRLHVRRRGGLWQRRHGARRHGRPEQPLIPGHTGEVTQ